MWPQVWDQHAEQSDPQPPGSRWGQEFKLSFETKSVCAEMLRQNLTFGWIPGSLGQYAGNLCQTPEGDVQQMIKWLWKVYGEYEDFSANLFLVFRSIQAGPTPTSLVINDDGNDNTLDDTDDNDDDDDTWQMRVHQHWGSQLGDIR